MFPDMVGMPREDIRDTRVLCRDEDIEGKETGRFKSSERPISVNTAVHFLFGMSRRVSQNIDLATSEKPLLTLRWTNKCDSTIRRCLEFQLVFSWDPFNDKP